jgi:hypothetical protein
VEYGAASNENVTFESGSTGTLRLDNSGAFTGTVAGLNSNGTHSDTLDLQDINFASGVSWSFNENANGQQGVLTVADGNGHVANISLLGQYLAAGTSATSASSTLFQTATDNSTNTAGTLITTNFHQ